LNLRYTFPRASKDFLALNDPGIPTPKLEQNQKEALGRTEGRKASCVGRTRVSFKGFFVRPLDPDNHAGSCKDLLDGLWRCGLIDGDAPWQIELITSQERVNHFSEERIEIEIAWR